jgi:hypothetical protein
MGRPDKKYRSFKAGMQPYILSLLTIPDRALLTVVICSDDQLCDYAVFSQNLYPLALPPLIFSQSTTHPLDQD